MKAQRDSDPEHRPFADRPAKQALRSVLALFRLLRLASEPLYVIVERASTTRWKPRVYVGPALPLREAQALLLEMLEPYPPGHEWRWRLGLCPAGEITREAWHALLMKEPGAAAAETSRTNEREGTNEGRGLRKPRASARAEAEQTVCRVRVKRQAKERRAA